MNNSTKKIYAVRIGAFLLAAMLVTATGCKKSGGDSTSSDSYVYSSESEVSSVTSDDASSDTSSLNESSKGGKSSSTGSSGNKVTSSSKANASSSKTQSGSKKKDDAVRDLGGRKITFLCAWEEPTKGGSEFENAYWKQKNYIEKTYNCKFVHKVGTTGFFANWMASVMAGKPSADIIASDTAPYKAISNGVFYDLSKLDELDFSEDKWCRASTQIGSVNGKIYTMWTSRYLEKNHVLYNKNLLKKAGQSDLWTLQKKGELTLERFSQIAKACAQNGRYGITAYVNPFQLHSAYAMACGGFSVTRKGTSLSFNCNINSQPVLNGYSMAQELINSGVADDGTKWTDWTYAQQEFVKGNVAIMVGGVITDAFEKSDFDVGICAMPTTDGKMLNVADQVYYTAIAYNAEKPDEVALIWDKMNEVIAVADYKIRYQDLVSDDAWEYINTVVKQQKNGMQVSYQFLGDMYSNGIYSNLMQMVKGDVPVSTTLQTIEPVFKNEISQFN